MLDENYQGGFIRSASHGNFCWIKTGSIPPIFQQRASHRQSRPRNISTDLYTAKLTVSVDMSSMTYVRDSSGHSRRTTDTQTVQAVQMTRLLERAQRIVQILAAHPVNIVRKNLQTLYSRRAPSPSKSIAQETRLPSYEIPVQQGSGA